MTRLIELYAENFMGLKAVRIRPKSAVTKIIGKNAAGKSSVLQALVAAIGGKDFVPDRPIRNGTSSAKVILDLGDLKVKRRFTPSGTVLEVLSADGTKYPSPQSKLDALFGPISIDPLAFKNLKPKEKMAMVAKIAGIDIEKFAKDKKALFDERTNVNRDLKTAEAQLAGMSDVAGPDEEVSVAALLQEISQAEQENRDAENKLFDARQQQQNIVNENERLEHEFRKVDSEGNRIDAELSRIDKEIARLNGEKERLVLERVVIDGKLATAKQHQIDHVKKLAQDADAALAAAKSLPRIDITPLRAKIADAESNNAKVRQRAARQVKHKEVERLKCKAHDLTIDIDAIDNLRNEAIHSANLPVPGLALSDDGVLLKGVPFEQCSESEQIRASVAIGLGTKASVKIMRIKDGSLLDNEGRRILEEMAEAADAQVLIELVDTGSEQGVRIVDGEVSEQEPDGYTEPTDADDVATVATDAF